MKTNQLILAAALVALAACTKDSIDYNANTLDNEIGFNAVTKKATKANNAIISGVTYGTENTFQVWGWQSQKDGNSDENIAFSDIANDATSNFMTNLTISYCGGPQNRDDAWRNSAHYYYWPFTGKISFLAIHPSTVTPNVPKWDSQNAKPKVTIDDYTISTTNSTTDLMFAVAAGSKDSGLDAQGKLGLVFKHALSQIVVNVKTDADYTADVKFDINSVEFNKIDLSGDLAYQNEIIEWTDNDTQTQNWMYYNSVKENVNNTAAKYGAEVLMIPQDANADVASTTDVIEGTTLTISYSMQQLPLANNAKITGTVVVAAPWAKVKEGTTVHDPAVAIPGWEAGKKYVYTLNFKLNEILFSPAVTDWVEVDLTTIDIVG